MRRKRRLPAVLKGLIYLVLFGFACWTAIVAFITVKEYTIPEPTGQTQAMIVLGAQVKADGSLSLQLEWRMEETLRQYSEQPQLIVVCGAQGTNEPAPEAHVMRDWLIANGVPSEKILMDDASFNTRQNIENARKLLPQGINRVLIVTSKYHLPRAMALAEDMGFETEGAGSPIKLIYWPKNHYREALAWVKYLLQKVGVMPY